MAGFALPQHDPGAPSSAPPYRSAPRRLETSQLDRLLELLRADGYAIIGPRVHDGVIVYDTVDRLADLPRGFSDEQEPGRYRLTRPGHEAYCAYAVGPHSWKRALFPPTRRTFTAVRATDGALSILPEPLDQTPRAFVGVRACELAAIAIQDRVFIAGSRGDLDYASRRSAVVIVAVQCTTPAGTCFCASMGTGPRASAGYDIALTEVDGSGEHFFTATAGSAVGERLLSRLDAPLASTADLTAAEERVASAAQRMGRTMSVDGLHELLARSHDSPRWDSVAERCLTCTNCTMVCPTCFCSGIDDVPLLDGDRAERWRRWDSCFTTGFSYIHGGSVRSSGAARYRQWLTHKLGTWWDQFGSSGCVGCGRCITWCPVGIDLTEEVAALRTDDEAPPTRGRAVEEGA